MGLFDKTPDWDTPEALAIRSKDLDKVEYVKIGTYFYHANAGDPPAWNVPRAIMRLEADGLVVDDLWLLPGTGFRTDGVILRARPKSDG